MHQHTINASLQVVPLAQDKHPYAWVDEAIEIIQQSGLKYQVGAFATEIEGTHEEVLKLVTAINNYLQEKGCAEWILNVQLQMRCDSAITGDEKKAKFQ